MVTVSHNAVGTKTMWCPRYGAGCPSTVLETRFPASTVRVRLTPGIYDVPCSSEAEASRAIVPYCMRGCRYHAALGDSIRAQWIYYSSTPGWSPGAVSQKHWRVVFSWCFYGVEVCVCISMLCWPKGLVILRVIYRKVLGAFLMFATRVPL